MSVSVARGRLAREPLSGRGVAAAMELIDQGGVRQLSMRRIGKALGVEAMALYRYVPSREDLLDGVVERVVDELYADPQVHLLPTPGGRSTSSGSRTGCAGWRWLTCRSFPWSPAARRLHRGCARRCARCAGSSRCSPA